MKGQKRIRVVAPDAIDDSGKVTSIKADTVFDVTQTQELPHRTANTAKREASTS